MQPRLAGRVQLQILYEDDLLFVVAKPAGLHSVLGRDGSRRSAAGLLLAADPELSRAAEKPGDAGLVQRLDLETSGCLLGAKRLDVWRRLYHDLRAGLIHKSYLALVEGAPADTQLDTLIGSPYRRAGKVRVAPAEKQLKRMLPAHSEFKRLAYRPEEDLALVRASAPTARRHQLRAHLAWLGHPLAGDALYGSRRTLPADSVGRAFFLHAERIVFAHPSDERRVQIAAPLPEFMQALFAGAADL